MFTAGAIDRRQITSDRTLETAWQVKKGITWLNLPTILRKYFFTRFFARHPEQQALFFQPRVSCGAMVNEILDSLLGLAAHEGWVNSSIHNLVIAHRCYGDFPPSLYAELLDVFVDTLADLAGERWNAGYDAAWRQLAAELHKLIVSAH